MLEHLFQAPRFTPDEDGLYHFRLDPGGPTFTLRPPTFGDIKRAHELCPPPSGNVYLDGLSQGEQLAMLLLVEVDGRATSYQKLLAAGGLGGAFPSAGDAQAVIETAQALRQGGRVVPLATKRPSEGGGTPPPTSAAMGTNPSPRSES